MVAPMSTETIDALKRLDETLELLVAACEDSQRMLQEIEVGCYIRSHRYDWTLGKLNIALASAARLRGENL